MEEELVRFDNLNGGNISAVLANLTLSLKSRGGTIRGQGLKITAEN